MDQVGYLEQLHQDFKDRVSFFVVYIGEIHLNEPIHIFKNGKMRELVVRGDNTQGQRLLRSRRLREYGLTMPILIDDEALTVQQAYRALPQRMVLVDQNGKVQLASWIGDMDAVMFRQWMTEQFK